MTLTNKQLLEFAKTQDPQDTFDLNSSDNWLAALAATQLSGQRHGMNGWQTFAVFGEDLEYTSVSPEYARWCKSRHEEDRDQSEYTSFEDAIEALESFD